MSRQFGIWDWGLFISVLSISAFIGIFYAIRSCLGAFKNTTGDYLMGGRQLRLLPVSISIQVSFISAITILGAPVEMYTAGTLYFLYTLGLALACVLAAVIFVPLLYPLRLTSSFEYLELRFESRAAKLTGTFMMIVEQILYMGIAIYAPSTALEAMTGFPTWASILTIGGLSTFYTCLGGIKAVVWTDVFQSFFIIAGLLAIVVQGFLKLGGAEEVWRLNTDWNRIDFWQGNPDPTVRHSAWSLVFGGAMMWFGKFAVSQPSVQRYCAVSTLKLATWAILLNIVGIVILMTLTCLAGIVMFAYYAKEGCDPLTDGKVDNANQLLPYFVMEILAYPGFPGLFVSCLFSGALSTISSSLNALAAVCWEDICKPVVGNKVPESTKTWIIKLIVAVFGATGVGFAFMAKNLGGTVLQAALSFTGAASGPQLGIFLLGGLFQSANALGCVVGGLSGLTMSMWFSVGAYGLPSSGYSLQFPTVNCTTHVYSNPTTTIPDASAISGIENIYTISYLWFPTIGTVTTIIVGLVVSIISAPYFPKHEVDSKYLIPIFDRLFCWLPESWRCKYRCGNLFKEPEDLIRNEERYTMRENDEKSEITNEFDGEDHKQPRSVRFQNGASGVCSQTKSETVYRNTEYIADDSAASESLNTASVL